MQNESKRKTELNVALYYNKEFRRALGILSRFNHWQSRIAAKTGYRACRGLQFKGIPEAGIKRAQTHFEKCNSKHQKQDGT
jgi:hypothetical protein